MRRKLLLAFFLSLLSILPAQAEWLIAECSAYTPYDCGTITATGETVHVGGVACNFLPFGTVVVIDGLETTDTSKSRITAKYLSSCRIKIKQKKESADFGSKLFWKCWSTTGKISGCRKRLLNV